MRVLIQKFGTVLTSRQSGREAYAAFRPTLNNLGEGDKLTLDFEGVEVLSPSWADEFLTPLLHGLDQRLTVTHTSNASVKLTLETLEEILNRSFRGS